MAPSGDQSAWKALGELSTVGLTLVVATVIGLAGGRLQLDAPSATLAAGSLRGLYG